ncbi:MAG: AMP-binding protein, partial [Cytophagales bacterium]|nr:AMP-binding protein [Cytophagales bacterium]
MRNIAFLEDKSITFIEGHAQERTLTYKEILDHALRVLHHLQAKGIRKDDELVIQLEDNLSFIVVFWACLLGGIRPVPLSVGSQDAHRQKLFTIWPLLKNPSFISNDAVLARLDKYVPDPGVPTALEGIKRAFVSAEDAQAESTEGIIEDVAPGDIALIQFTSGSTGEPKGVTLTHENLMANTRDIVVRSAISPGDAMLSWMPLTHDMGLICFHLTGLVAHVNQFLMPTALFIRRPALWLEKASQHKVSLLYSPNFGYQYVLSALEATAPAAWDLSAVRLIYNGAEPISADLCDRFLQTLAPAGLSGSVIYPGYGLAEASVAVTMPKPGAGVTQHWLQRQKLNLGDQVQFVPGPEHPGGVSFVEVGYPIDHCQVRISGNQDEPLAERTIGHIQIKGSNVTCGYYCNPDATRKTLTSDGWLRTGDLGFMRAGKLTITGRHKNIIILNGQNYYPQDLERMVQEVEGAELGKVVACGTNTGNAEDELVIFVLNKKALEDFVPIAMKIRERISTQTGLVAARIIPVRKIPKTTSGKIQHFQLLEGYKNGEFGPVTEALDALTAAAGRERGNGRSVADVLHSIVAEISERHEVTESDDFFELGFNSIQAARLVTRIQAQLGTFLTLREIFACRSIAALATYLERKPAGAPERLEVAPQQAFYPLSATQHRFWVLDQFDRQKAPCNLFSAHAVQGEWDVEALEEALAAVVKRHDSLRTTFALVNGVPGQMVGDAAGATFRITRTDLTGEADREAITRSLVGAEAAAPFDLATGPLMRVRVIKTDDRQYVFTFTIHHIIADGWSIGLLISEANAFYTAGRAGRQAVLPPLPFQYKDYMHWQQKQSASPQWERSRAYWLREMDGEIPGLQLPACPVPGTVPSFRGAQLNFSFDAALNQALHGLSRASNVTLFVTLTTLLRVVLYRYTLQKDLVLGTNTTGRDHHELENQIGCFINTVALRLPLTGQESFAELLQHVQEKVLNAFEHQHYPFEHLLEELRGTREGAHMPLFDVLILLQNLPYSVDFNRLFGDSNARPYPWALPTSLVDLQFEFAEEGKHLALKVTYNPDRYDASLIGELVRNFRTAASAVIASSGAE